MVFIEAHMTCLLIVRPVEWKLGRGEKNGNRLEAVAFGVHFLGSSDNFSDRDFLMSLFHKSSRL